MVFEDAINGVISGNRAGCETLAVLTTHRRDQLVPTNPTYLVRDLSKYVSYSSPANHRLTSDQRQCRSHGRRKAEDRDRDIGTRRRAPIPPVDIDTQLRPGAIVDARHICNRINIICPVFMICPALDLKRPELFSQLQHVHATSLAERSPV